MPRAATDPPYVTPAALSQQTVVCNALNFLDEWWTPFAEYKRVEIPAHDPPNVVCLDVAADSDNVAPASPIVVVLHGIMVRAAQRTCPFCSVA